MYCVICFSYIVSLNELPLHNFSGAILEQIKNSGYTDSQEKANKCCFSRGLENLQLKAYLATLAM